MIVHSKVEDFEKWKSVFEENSNFRKEAGAQSHRVFQDAQDPNKLTIMFEWESVEKAKEFFRSEEVKQKMKEAGVIEDPQIHFINEV